ncbi:hypothetical protein B7494_g2749 [Chlorociboria aeruginascens]|nr:hypothetical protein B7494_g2749 [Chlorociboria aeruginascens]
MAEALALIGLVSAVVNFADVGTRVAERLRDFRKSGQQLPGQLSDVSAQLDLLIDIANQVRGETVLKQLSERRRTALLQTINGCTRRTQELATMIEKIAISEGDSRATRVVKAFRAIGQESKIQAVVRVLETYKSLIALNLLQDTLRYPNEVVRTMGVEHYQVPSLKVLQFWGRVETLQTVATCLRPCVCESPKIAVLFGMGGAGKTQIALEYCKQSWKSREFRHIFWVDATSLESIQHSYKKIASCLAGGPEIAQGLKSTVEFVKDAVGRLSTPWLIVYDNFDSPRKVTSIQEFLPNEEKGCGAILFTSRHLDACRLGATVRVDPMSVPDSLDLFFCRTHLERSNSNIALARKIIIRLGCLPLAIDQAAAFIRSRQLNLNNFNEQFVKLSTTSLWSTTPQIWEYKKRIGKEESQTALSICTTWEMSFGELEGNLPRQQSIGRLLSFLALFGRSDISEKLAVALTKQQDQSILETTIFLTDGTWDNHKFQDTLVELYGLSILQSIDLGPDVSSFSLHPMIAEWLKLRIDLREQILFIEAASNALNEILGRRLEDLERCFFEDGQKLLGYIENLMDSSHELISDDSELGGISVDAMTTFARYYCHFEKYDESEAMYKKIIEVYDRDLNARDISKLDIFHDLGLCLREAGKFSEAEVVFEKAIEGKIARVGKDHPSTLRSMNGLGVTNRRAQNYDRAEQILSYVVDVGPRVLGLQNPLYRSTINNFAVLLRYQNRLTEAQQYVEKSLVLHLEASGFFNVSTLDSHRCLGLILRDQGKLKEAEEIFLRNLEGQEKLWGPLHSSTLFTISVLEKLYLKIGLENKAKEMRERMHGELGHSLLRDWQLRA